MEAKNPQSNYWLDLIARDIAAAHPEGEIVVSTGLSPSGFYHLGSTREPVTASAIVWALRQLGRKARHIYFSDDFDVLRKVPAGLSEDLHTHLGQPLYLAPSPDGKAASYADYFDADRADAMARGGFEPDEVVRARDSYPKGTYTKAIEQALSKLDRVKAIINEVSGRELAEDWVPVQLLDEEGYLNRWRFAGWNQQKQVINYVDLEGNAGELDYTGGRVKLDWRLDWPARWAIWGVQVEPFGRDHATKGGSYDTGKALVTEIFGSQAPYPVPYEFVNQAGQTKKMSKSAGGAATAQDVLEIIPPEIFRYFMVRSRPAKTLVFDPGLPVSALIDEYAAAEAAVAAGEEHPFADAYRYASDGSQGAKVVDIPFSHLVTTYQTAGGELEQIVAILERTGYQLEDRKPLEAELGYVANWLKHHAPDKVKFAIQEKLPKTELTPAQELFVDHLATSIEDHQGAIDGPAMHQLIYTAKDSADLKPVEAFSALYNLILGQDSGPKAGWFLAGLERPWLIGRLRRQA